jgi:hypothetical protein
MVCRLPRLLDLGGEHVAAVRAVWELAHEELAGGRVAGQQGRERAPVRDVDRAGLGVARRSAL